MVVQKVQNWRDVIKRAWVMWVLYGMAIVQLIAIVQRVIDQGVVDGLLSVGVKDAILTVLIPLGMWVRVLHQVTLQVFPMPPAPPAGPVLKE